MKGRCVLLVVALIVLPVVAWRPVEPSQAQEATEAKNTRRTSLAKKTGLVLVASTPKKEYRLGERIDLDVSIRNDGDKRWTVYLAELGEGCNVTPVVITPTGDTHEYFHGFCSAPPEIFGVPLLPNAAWSYRWTDFRNGIPMRWKPGLYKIYASYEWDLTPIGGDRFFAPWRGKLVSNTLTITIKK